MIVVIQCAASKRSDAGYWQRRNGEKLLFVADPDGAPVHPGVTCARPDDLDAAGIKWRQKVIDYNRNSGDNPLGLLPAWKLYANSAYELLQDRFGIRNLYILSAGWGLIAADFLTPMYDITFSGSAERYKRRMKRDVYEDLRMLPDGTDEPVVFLGGKDYVELFCRLTADVKRERTVFYNSATAPAAPGCTLKRFDTSTRTNWHYECARALVGQLSSARLSKTVSASSGNSLCNKEKNGAGKRSKNLSNIAAKSSRMVSKYDPLNQHLASLSPDLKAITISFVELEKLLGFDLPKSATDYRQWWANQAGVGSHSQAHAWMSAGFKVDNVALKRPGGHVRFRRG